MPQPTPPPPPSSPTPAPAPGPYLCASSICAVNPFGLYPSLEVCKQTCT
jgi:hypothetical protein